MKLYLVIMKSTGHSRLSVNKRERLVLSLSSSINIFVISITMRYTYRFKGYLCHKMQLYCTL